jgi:hypothetical protein
VAVAQLCLVSLFGEAGSEIGHVEQSCSIFVIPSEVEESLDISGQN